MRIPKHLLGAVAALALASVPAVGQGRWLAAYPPAQDPVHAQLQQMFSEQDVLASMLEPMNQEFQPPRDVTVELAECGQPGAFYDPARPAVQLCYELLVELVETLSDPETGDETLFVGAFAFVMLHQVGHAFVDVLQLPVDVPVEEAADQFAAVMAGFAPEELGMMANGAAGLHESGINWENPGSDRPGLTDERLARITCLIYGSKPELHAEIVEDGGLSAEAAAACVGQYAALEQAWIEMLAAHIQG